MARDVSMPLPKCQENQPEAAGISSSQRGLWIFNEGRRATIWRGNLSDCSLTFSGFNVGMHSISDNLMVLL